jgi:glycosyltransferase involved in cell wall biosynthesis
MKLLVFDSHPVQYRVPVWRILAADPFSEIHVGYASDCSVRGTMDSGFGREVAWDDPVLEGYPFTILSCENGKPLSGWNSITGKGVEDLLLHIRPDAVLLTGLNYRYDLVAYLMAIRHGIPLWLRCETQDHAVFRSAWKGALRSLVYRLLYKGFSRIFYIGELNRRHYLKHGLNPSQLVPARYGTVDRFEAMSQEQKTQLRDECRAVNSIADDAVVIGFSGKLIPKKNPDILYEMLEHLPDEMRKKTFLYFLGSGEMEVELRSLAEKCRERWGVRSHFAGFVNQSQLASHYLAMDIMVLPSRRMGETWGLVCNEAMQAGCSVVVSDCVGCGTDFKDWSRFKIFNSGKAEELAERIAELHSLPRDFNWATDALEGYSLIATAKAISSELEALVPIAPNSI